MKYTIQRLDKRFSYHNWFEYYIGFGAKMSYNRGPEQFTQAQEWFFRTYGWSAEIRNYAEMYNWAVKTVPTIRSANKGHIIPVPKERPVACNPSWSWTNGYDDLRIYVATAQELTMFQLAFPKDVKQ